VGLQHCFSCIRRYCGEIPDAEDEEGSNVRVSFQLSSGTSERDSGARAHHHILREEGERGSLAPFVDRHFIASF